MAAADFGNGSRVDLAIGIGSEGLATQGAVAVIFAGRDGLAAAKNQLWSQDTSGILDARESDDRFGHSLAAADLGRSTQADLVVGIPGESTAQLELVGAAGVIYGSTNGLTAVGNQLWSQDSPGIRAVASCLCSSLNGAAS